MNETPETARAVAEQYVGRGWAVIPVPFQSKNPNRKGWERWRITLDQLGDHFNGHPQNIGVLLGEPSGWLIDVDLDHMRAVELAPQFLPQTDAVFGRPGKPRSHWLYRVTSPAPTKKFRSKSAGMLVEFRSTGMQTVFPPSTHESGEPIQWVDPDAEPATVDPQELLNAVKQLAETVLVELGEKVAPRPPKPKRAVAALVDATLPMAVPAQRRYERCLAAMLRMDMVDNHDGSSRLYAAACRAIEHDLDDANGLAAIREYARQHPFPRDWSDQDALRRMRDAENVCTRGKAIASHLDDEGLVRLGTRDPKSGRLVLSPKRTLPTAEAFVADFYQHPDGRTLHSHAGVLMAWRSNRYVEVEENEVRQRIQRWLHDALRYAYNPQTQEVELVPFDSNPASVNGALDTLRSHVHVPVSIAPPAWLGQSSARPEPRDILPCRSMLLHLPSMERLPPAPTFFNTNALEFDPNLEAPEAHSWQRFLHQLFDGDLEALELLQEWFGYCLTPDTSQQKMLLIVGPRRSGKGTIARVLNRLIGSGNVCGPTTSSLAGPFGLQPLIGKSLAIVSDARFSGDNIQTVVERLLCISGEDSLSVDRKFLGSISMTLPTRFMFLSNELPRLSDASGALAGRFLLLRLTESFYGREDTTLTRRLLEELPGILNWAIGGWRRLRERGYFVMPPSAMDAVADMEDLSSPVGAFVRADCIVGADYRILVDDLFAAWKRWSEREGRTTATTRQSFGRNLMAAVPGVARRRGSGDVPFYAGIGLKRGSP